MNIIHQYTAFIIANPKQHLSAAKGSHHQDMIIKKCKKKII
jgi:hypothetical protein